MIVAYLVLLIAFLDNFAMLPTIGPYAERLGADLTGVGVAVGAYSLTNLLLNIAGGALVDRLGRRRLVVTSLLGVGATMLLYPMVSSVTMLIGVRLLHGVAGGVLVPAVFTAVADLSPEGGRGRSMGRAGAAIGAAAVIGPAVGGALRQLAGFEAVFLGVAALCVLGALIAGLGLPETSPQAGSRSGTRGALLDLLRDPHLRVAYGTAVVFTGAVGSMAAFLPVHVEGLGLPAASSGGMFTLFALAAVALMLSRMAGLVELRGAALPIVSGLSVLAIALTALTAEPSALPTAVAATVFGVGFGLVFPAMSALVGAAAPPQRRGAAYGFFMAAYSLGFVVMPPLGGAVADRWSSLGPFAAAAVVCAAAAGVLALRWRRVGTL